MKMWLSLIVCMILFAVMVNANPEIECDTRTWTSYGFLGDTLEWTCTINSSNTYDCVSYVKDTVGGIVQANPDYIKRTDAIIGLNNKIEDRQTFTAQNGIANIYFTKDNLLFDGRNYTYGVKCAYDGDVLTYEESNKVLYENINNPQSRILWFKNNTQGLWTLFILFLVGFFLFMAVRFLIWEK